MRKRDTITAIDAASTAPRSITRLIALVALLFTATKIDLCQAAPPGNAYCGVHSVYAAIQSQGGEVSLNELVQSEYIGSPAGSTLAQLQRAVQDHGMHALPMDNLTTAALRASSQPVILHVMGSDRRRSYDHWLLFLRASGDGALIYDAPHPPSVVSWRDLAARWDGTGLAVSASPIDPAELRRPSRQWLLLYLAIGIALVFCIQLFRSRRAPLSSATPRQFVRACA